MMCYFVARTNWLNIKSNYFVNSIIIFNLSYYTNIPITVTFVNHLTLVIGHGIVAGNIAC